ncbi:kinase-like domain-containing protein [Trametes elegans]|nr:kinase-like domain-containing protein [Trametes elegans]
MPSSHEAKTICGTEQQAPAGSNFPGGLTDAECWWRDHQVWLQERGYMLRPRYRPGWVPSWHKDADSSYFMREDGKNILRGHVLDATRISDGAVVTLKQIKVSQHPYEISIIQLFSSEPCASDPANHCIPAYEVLDVPDDTDLKIIVMPFLRKFFDPRFLTIGEAAEFFRQTFEGLQFMHAHNVAHRDCGRMNIMMDPRPLYPNLYHPISIRRNPDMSGTAKHYTRTRRPVKYYLIDFGLSRRYNPAKGPPRSYPIWGGDRSVPEFHKSVDEPCDPFPTDVYYLGNVIRTEFLQEFSGLEFMQPLVDDMVQEEPASRPTMDQVVARFDVLLGSLSSWKLRSRLPQRNEFWLVRWFRVTAHAFRTLHYLLTFRPALPRA